MLFQIKHEYLACLDNEQMNAYKQLKNLTLPDFVVHSFRPPMEEAMSRL